MEPSDSASRDWFFKRNVRRPSALTRTPLLLNMKEVRSLMPMSSSSPEDRSKDRERIVGEKNEGESREPGSGIGLKSCNLRLVSWRSGNSKNRQLSSSSGTLSSQKSNDPSSNSMSNVRMRRECIGLASDSNTKCRSHGSPSL